MTASGLWCAGAPNYAQDDGINSRCEDSGLGLFAQILECDVADGGGDDGDGEVLDGEDVFEGDGEGLAGAVDAVELAHEQVGKEEEDDERNLDHRTADGGEQARVFGVLSHDDMGR